MNPDFYGYVLIFALVGVAATIVGGYWAVYRLVQKIRADLYRNQRGFSRKARREINALLAGTHLDRDREQEEGGQVL